MNSENEPKRIWPSKRKKEAFRPRTDPKLIVREIEAMGDRESEVHSPLGDELIEEVITLLEKQPRFAKPLALFELMMVLSWNIWYSTTELIDQPEKQRRQDFAQGQFISVRLFDQFGPTGTVYLIFQLLIGLKTYTEMTEQYLANERENGGGKPGC